MRKAGAITAPRRMIDHWWWRPGWSVGRRYYMCYVTFVGDEAVRGLAGAYGRRLRVPTLDVVPPEWLHLTTLGVAFVDEIDEVDVHRIADAARRRLAGLAPIAVQVGPAVVYPEVVRLQVTPSEPLAVVRQELGAAVADAWGADRVLEGDRAFFDGQGFVPHVSLAYSNGDADMRSILDAVRHDEPAPVTTTVRCVDLVAVHRDSRMYEWTTVAHADLAGEGER